MNIGYARVSTKEQSNQSQIEQLKKAGCHKIFADVASGAKANRPEFEKLKEHLRPGDTIVITKLDRLGRSLHHLVNLIEKLNNMSVGLKSITDPIDTTTSKGKLIFNIFGSVAEFERDLIRERTKAGLESARARGRKGGRKPGLSEESQVIAASAEAYYLEGKLSTTEICSKLNISRPTLYKYLRYRKVKISNYTRSSRT